MKQDNRYLKLDPYEWRLMVAGLNAFRTMLLEKKKLTEDVDELILKIIDTPTKKR